MLQDTKEWQLIELPTEELGSFKSIKVKLVNPYQFLNSRGKVVLHHETLPDAKGYQSLDGREFTVRQGKAIIAYLRTEDCGLGSRKAHMAMSFFGYRF